MEQKIYIVLTQTSSNLSKMIKLFTKARYNHSSISLSPDLEPMYSFGRIYPYNPFWGGFVKEYPRKGTFHRFPKTVTAVLELEVDEEIYRRLQIFLEGMYQEKKKYGYNMFGLCLAAFGIRFHPKNQYYCSEFIQELFQKCRVPHYESLGKIVEPSQLLKYPTARLVYQGLMREYSYPEPVPELVPFKRT